MKRIALCLLAIMLGMVFGFAETQPEGVPADVWGKVSRQIRAERYAFREREDGALAAHNRKQGMGTGGKGSGFSVHGSEGTEIVFSVAGLGYGDEL